MKNMIFGVWLAMALVAVFSLVTAIPAQAAVIHVPGDYATIQAAVDAASAGDTVMVAAGTYEERLLIDGAARDNISLVGGTDGSGAPASVIDLSSLGEGAGIWIKDAGNVVIRNFEIHGASGTSGETRGWGIVATTADGVVIDNVFSHHNAADGIRVRQSVNATVKNCVAVNNSDGIIFYAYGSILNNVVGDSSMRGIYVNGEEVGPGRTGSVTISGNHVYNNLNGPPISSTDHRVGGIIVYSAMHVPAVHYVEVEDNVVHDNVGPGILLYKVNNEHIDGSYLNPGRAVSPEYKSIVRGNVISGHRDRETMGPGDGILLYMSHYVTIEDNVICGNEDAGVRITNDYRYNIYGPTTNNTVINNKIRDNQYSVYVQGNANYEVEDTVARCNILSNNVDGVVNLDNFDESVDATYNWWGDPSGPSGGAVDPWTGVIADGIGDPVSSNVLFYPWLTAPTCKHAAFVVIHPETLNLRSKGRWITAYIRLPEGYAVEDIDVATVRFLHQERFLYAEWGEIQADCLMVRFDRAVVAGWFDGLHNEEVELTVTGEVNGAPFEGMGTIRVISPPAR